MRQVKVQFRRRYRAYREGQIVSVQPNVAKMWTKAGLVGVLGDSPARECATIEHDAEQAVMPRPKRKYVRRRNDSTD